MPRLSHRPPKLRKHATGQAFVSDRGKAKYLGRWGSPEAKAAYRKFCREWKPAPVVASVPDSERTTVNELLLAFAEHAVLRYRKADKPTSSVHLFAIACRVTREMFGHVRCREFGPVRLRQVREKFVERGVSRRTANRYANLLVQVFRWGTSRELVPVATWQALTSVEPLKATETTARDTKPVRVVSDADVDKTLPHCSATIKAMIQFQRFTGCRPSEVCSLRWADVDRTADIWLYKPPGHKLEHLGIGRTICIGPKAQETLAPFLQRPSEAFVFDPREAVKARREADHKARVTPISQGNRPGTNRRRKPNRTPGGQYTTASYRRAVQRAAELAKVDPWGPNRLRHNVATEARKIIGLEASQVILGHTSRATTEAHYAEPDIGKAIEAARMLG